MARKRQNYTQGGERVGRSKMVVGGKVMMPDGTKGTVRNVFGPPKSRRAVIVSEGGQSYNMRVADLTPTAGRPTQHSAAPMSGQLSEAVARGQAPDSSGKHRAPMPERVLNKLKGLGVIGGGANEGVVDPSFEPDLVDVTNKRPGSDGNYRNGGFVRVSRKSSFKGVF